MIVRISLVFACCLNLFSGVWRGSQGNCCGSLHILDRPRDHSGEYTIAVMMMMKVFLYSRLRQMKNAVRVALNYAMTWPE